MFKRKLAISSLILSLLLNLSCTLSLTNTGNIAFNLPVPRNASRENGITFNIMLQKLNGEIVNSFIIKSSKTNTPVLLKDIASGEYKLIVFGNNSSTQYYGESLVTIVPNEVCETEIVLSKGIKPIHVNTFRDLENAINISPENSHIVIDRRMEIDRQIIIDKAVTISSSKDVTLTRASSFNKSMFLVKKGPFTLGNDSNTITLDGNKDVVTSLESLIRSDSNSIININNCILQNNFIDNFNTKGGAIYIENGGTLNIKNSFILNNNSLDINAGGGIAAMNATVNVINTSIENNRAYNGGACYFYKCITQIDNNKNCHIQKNEAKLSGGGIFMALGSLNIVNGEINNNRYAIADTEKSYGHNLAVDSYTFDCSDPIILNGKKVSPGFTVQGPLNKDTIDPNMKQ